MEGGSYKNAPYMTNIHKTLRFGKLFTFAFRKLYAKIITI